MSLIKWKKRNGMFPTVSSIFDDFFADDDSFLKNWKAKEMMPSVNVKNEEHRYCLEVAVPGLKKEDFKVEVNKGVLTISSESKEESKEENNNYSRREFSYSSFSRSFWLPEEVNEDDIEATYNDGILNVIIPKLEKTIEKEVKKIEIK